ncbi:hypothetical protein [Mycolicibacterium iranicum]|uniref:hypothetical protein n=1 Tax=Mycolicibacterium iranicum TaxID=912594 RepID=UPI001055320E|nr:hypothetical protein [Mycolicibacterium iranicum]
MADQENAAPRRFYLLYRKASGYVAVKDCFSGEQHFAVRRRVILWQIVQLINFTRWRPSEIANCRP